MKRTMLAVLAIGVLVAADGVKDDPKKDQDTAKNPLEGAWKGVSGEVAGMAMPDEAIKDMEFIVKGDQYTVKVKGEEIETGTFKVDATKKPKTIDFDIKKSKGDDAGKTQVGLYEADKDTLKICVAEAGKKDRPKELSAKAGTMHILFVLKRAK